MLTNKKNSVQEKGSFKVENKVLLQGQTKNQSLLFSLPSRSLPIIKISGYVKKEVGNGILVEHFIILAWFILSFDPPDDHSFIILRETTAKSSKLSGAEQETHFTIFHKNKFVK